MSSGEQSAPSRLSGIFQKKSEEEKVDNAAATKKKKHKKRPSVTSETECSQPETEVDGNQGASDDKVPNEKEKPRSMRRRLPFGRQKSLEKHKLKPGAKGKVPEETAMDGADAEPTNPVKFETDGQNIQSGSENEDKETLLSEIAETVPADQVSEIASKIEERASMLSHETYPDGIPNPEGQIALEKKMSLIPITISSNFQWEICLYVYDYSLRMLMGAWSFVVSRASDVTEQLLLYFFSALVKRYPHSFKLQVKKKKRQRENALENEGQTAQAKTVATED